MKCPDSNKEKSTTFGDGACCEFVKKKKNTFFGSTNKHEDHQNPILTMKNELE